MTNVRKNSAKLTREVLKIAPESPTMKLSETPAVEPSDQTSKTVRHAPLVYRVEEIAQLLAISNRAAYNLCNTTKDFKVIRLGTSIRVSKQSFDDWFASFCSSGRRPGITSAPGCAGSSGRGKIGVKPLSLADARQLP